MTTTVTLYPVQANSAYEALVSGDYHAAPGASVEVENDSGALVQAYLQWDLSSIPAGAIVNSATIQLTQDGTSTQTIFYARRVTTPWDEDTLTWNNRPSYSSPSVQFWTRLGTSAADPIDAGAIVQGWIDGSYPVHGVAITDGSSTETWFKRSTASLTIDYTPNNPPNSPTLTSMASGEVIDRAATNRASHAFSDPNVGDSQSKFDHRYRLVGAATWTEATEITPNGYVDYPAGTFAAGDYERQVRTYDAQGVVGPWSSSGFFTAADPPPTPTITTPVHLSTIGSNEVPVEWSTPSQDAYQLQVLDGGLVEHDTGTVVSSAARAYSAPLPVNNEDRTIRVRIRLNGLWSSWYSVTVSVSYTPPEVPLVVLQEAGTTILVQVTNPAGTTPVTHNRVLVDDGDGETVRVAFLPANGSWTYWTPRSGLDYEGRVRVVAVGDNGTEASSA